MMIVVILEILIKELLCCIIYFISGEGDKHEKNHRFYNNDYYNYLNYCIKL